MSKDEIRLKEPPWIIGSQKETMEWINATYPSKKEKKKHRTKDDYLRNLHIKFDFDVKRNEIKSDDFFSKIIGRKLIEEDFDLFKISEFILRGLAKAKFSNITKIYVDKKALYEHKGRRADLRKTILDVDEYSSEISAGRSAEITAVLDDIEMTVAKIRINKIHDTKEHSVEIQIKGRIKAENYHTFLNYLKGKIGLKDVDWYEIVDRQNPDKQL